MVKNMVRSEFFTRKDLSPVQRCFLEFFKAFFFMLKGAVGAFEQDYPDAVQQVAHQCDVLDEVLVEALESFYPRNVQENSQFLGVLLLGHRTADVLRHLCDVASEPLEGLAEGRIFLGSLCRCLLDQIDWSQKRRLLGSQHEGAVRADLDLSLAEMTGELAGERRSSRVQVLLDFRDALVALRELFDLTEELLRLSDSLFPVEQMKRRR